MKSQEPRAESQEKPQRKRRHKRKDAGPELPMKAQKSPPRDKVFRRKNRSGRFYLRIHHGGKVVIKSARVKTSAAAEEMLRLTQRSLGKAVA